MCGIIGYIGKENALPKIIEGLRRESYRGYDSSGVAVFYNEKINSLKSVGKLDKLEEKISQNFLPGNMGLGHSRWATHGEVTENNAHPHTDCKNNIFLVHNGIIENYLSIKEKLLKKGHKFYSETDTEVLSHLIEHFFKGNLEEAVRDALSLVKGAYGIAVIAKEDPGKIVAARLSAPLVISINSSGGFVASDPSAILSYSNKMVFLDDKEIAVLKQDNFQVSDFNNNLKDKLITEIDWDVQEAKKMGYPHFMLKEIFEHPGALKNVLKGRLIIENGTAKLGGLDGIKEKLRDINKVQIIACGGSSYAAKVGEYMIEEYAGILTKVIVGSEFRYKKPVFDKNTLSIFISQSGETADTLAALREIKEKGGLAIGIVNVVGSTLARETGYGVYTRSGPEIAVASTKTFNTQIATLALIALFLGRQRQMSVVIGQRIVKELLGISDLAERVLNQKEEIKKISEKYKDYSNFILIGRKYNYPIALEGALKLKEVAYLHGEGIEAGELKHGHLALIGENFPAVAICSSDSVYEKTFSNIQEIKARKGKVIAIATEGNKEIKEIADDVIYIPKTLEMLTPILSTIPLHLFAYYMADLRGCDIDKPRNLAKSVTVE